MVNIELRLLSLMLTTGDFTPIQKGDLLAEHFITDQGRIVFNFIVGYRGETEGAARFPSLSIIRNRFDGSAIELPDPDPADDMAALLHETKLQKTRADLQGAGEQLIEIAQSSPQPIEQLPEIVTKLRSSLNAVQRAKHASFSENINELLLDYDCGGILDHGMPYPWSTLNEASRGLHRKEFVVIAGRPKSRKTFVAIACAANLVRHGYRVLFTSPEMPPKQILTRFTAAYCFLRYTEFKTSALDQAEMMRLCEEAKRLGRITGESDEHYGIRMHGNNVRSINGRLPDFDVVQSTGKPVTWIESQIELYDPDVVICDSFYRQLPPGKKKDDGWKDMTSTSRHLKDLAMDSDRAFVGTHQLNRGAETNVGSLSNLALADAVGQDADLILRVVTGKMATSSISEIANGSPNEKIPVSALLNLGGREIPIDGVLINNVPCSDFSEIGAIKSRKTVADLMKMEEEEEAEEEKKEKKAKKEEDAATKSIRAAGKKQKLGLKDSPLNGRIGKKAEETPQAAE